MTPDEAKWVRENVADPLHNHWGHGVCDKPAGLCAFCGPGKGQDHDWCQHGKPVAEGQMFVRGLGWRKGHVFPQVWLADRLCRRECPCACHQPQWVQPPLFGGGR